MDAQDVLHCFKYSIFSIVPSLKSEVHVKLAGGSGGSSSVGNGFCVEEIKSYFPEICGHIRDALGMSQDAIISELEGGSSSSSSSSSISSTSSVREGEEENGGGDEASASADDDAFLGNSIGVSGVCFYSRRRKLVVQRLAQDSFRHFVSCFEERAKHIIASPNSLLLKVIALVRIKGSYRQQQQQQQHHLQHAHTTSSSSKEEYYVLMPTPFPHDHHERIFSIRVNGAAFYAPPSASASKVSGGNGRSSISISSGGGGVSGVGGGGGGGKARFWSGDAWLEDADFSRDHHDLCLNKIKRAQLVGQIASDVSVLCAHGRADYQLAIVCTQREPLLGRQYLPGAPLGPEAEGDNLLPRDRRKTLVARHDLPLHTEHLPDALLPSPLFNSDKPNWEYYLYIVETTQPASTSASSSYSSSSPSSSSYDAPKKATYFSYTVSLFGFGAGTKAKKKHGFAESQTYKSNFLQFLSKRVISAQIEEEEEEEEVVDTSTKEGGADSLKDDDDDADCDQRASICERS